MANMAPQVLMDIVDSQLSVLQTSSHILSSPVHIQDQPSPDALHFILPLLIVLSTFLFILLIFLLCLIFIRRRRGIVLRDSDGPTDMSREELIEGEGGFNGVESRWLESVSEGVRLSYSRAKNYQLQFAPNSVFTDITDNQLVSIQEKGVSAWSFEPDCETLDSLRVVARTEITFLRDPASPSSVQSNLPLPKLNEVYYWEVKMLDLPQPTTVAVGLATKPYPPFRLPGQNPFSVAYHSSGDKCYNYPFTASPFGPVLIESDVLGVGYRPRTGTVFFTRNGCKMQDAFIGLSRYNLFPTIGADGPCRVHVNLGQAGFVFIEANVKKWGLAPAVGTLAAPPPYGSERGSILLDVGGASSRSGSHRSRRPNIALSSVPAVPSLLNPISSYAEEPDTPPPPITPIVEESNCAGRPNGQEYFSVTDLPFDTSSSQSFPFHYSSEGENEQEDGEETHSLHPQPRESEYAAGASSFFSIPRFRRESLTYFLGATQHAGSASTIQVHPPPDSPRSPNPPTPNHRDIHLQAFTRSMSASRQGRPEVQLVPRRHNPPAYSPLGEFTHTEGVHFDLAADVNAAALEWGSVPTTSTSQESESAETEERDVDI